MSNDPPQKPRSRLIVPGKADKPRTRLIAPAIDSAGMGAPEVAASEEEETDGEAAVGVPVSVAPLTPPPVAGGAEEDGEDGEPPIGEAEQGEFTVIDEDTGETHTVPVKVSSMVPPPVAVAVADPDPVPEPAADPNAEARALAEAEAAEAERQQAEYEAELAAYEQQKAEYEAAQQQAAYEAAQQQAYYAAQQQQAQYPPPPHALPRAPQSGGYPQRPMPGYGTMPVVMGGGVPGWALIMIGLLIGFVISVAAYKFTDFGKMIRPDSKRPVEQTSTITRDAGRGDGIV
jgi:hypothetical protein